jgi:hypothetical protein
MLKFIELPDDIIYYLRSFLYNNDLINLDLSLKKDMRNISIKEMYNSVLDELMDYHDYNSSYYYEQDDNIDFLYKDNDWNIYDV